MFLIFILVALIGILVLCALFLVLRIRDSVIIIPRATTSPSTANESPQEEVLIVKMEYPMCGKCGGRNTYVDEDFGGEKEIFCRDCCRTSIYKYLDGEWRFDHLFGWQ